MVISLWSIRGALDLKYAARVIRQVTRPEKSVLISIWVLAAKFGICREIM